MGFRYQVSIVIVVVRVVMVGDGFYWCGCVGGDFISVGYYMIEVQACVSLTIVAVDQLPSDRPIAWLLHKKAGRVPYHSRQVGKERVVVVPGEAIFPADLIKICCPLPCTWHDQPVEGLLGHTDLRRVQNMRHQVFDGVQVDVH